MYVKPVRLLVVRVRRFVMEALLLVKAKLQTQVLTYYSLAWRRT